MIIGDRVKKSRIAKGYSQRELGDLIKVSKVSICGYETGNRKPTIDTFIDLVNVLGVSPEYLLGLDINIVHDNSEYSIKMAYEDVEIIKQLKQNPELYNRIVENPKRMIDLIRRRVK